MTGDAYRTFRVSLEVGGYTTPGVPEFFWDPRKGCADVDPDVMTPASTKDIPDAVAVCEPCPFKTRCHEWAVETGQAHGVWGAVAPKERRLEIFARRKQAAAAPKAKPEPAPTRPVRIKPRQDVQLHARIRELYDQDKPDIAIALAVGLHPSTVTSIRTEVLRLPAKFGPGGQRKQVVPA